MDMGIIVAAALVVGITGIVIGLLLGAAGNIFQVKTDERVAKIRDCLPGNNCGGCGYPGCDGLAEAIGKGEAPVGACPVGGAPVSAKIAAIMGVEDAAEMRMCAFVACAGTCAKVERHSVYDGIQGCAEAAAVPGRGGKSCQYGCMGYGTCVSVCPFGAIHIVDGVAAVDKEACRGCRKCVEACPNHLIQMVPFEATVHVRCSSPEKGKDVRAVCQTGCIGCSLCTKVCPSQAVHMEGSLARISHELCTGCGACAEKCPAGVIFMERSDQ